MWLGLNKKEKEQMAKTMQDKMDDAVEDYRQEDLFKGYVDEIVGMKRDFREALKKDLEKKYKGKISKENLKQVFDEVIDRAELDITESDEIFN